MATGAWLAIPGAEGESQPLKLLHARSGFEREVGEPAMYRRASWSPGGAFVAAIRSGDEPELVIFDSRGNRDPVLLPVEETGVRIAWSPDAARIAVFRTGQALLVDPEGEIITRIEAPPEMPSDGTAGRGEWDTEGAVFAAPAGGALLLMERNGAAAFVDPDTFVRYPGETEEFEVTGWTEQGHVSVFVRSGEDRASQFILDVSADPPEVVSSSDFEGTAGPFDGLLASASERADTEVLLGRHAAPASFRWVVTDPPDGADPGIWIREDDEFALLPGEVTIDGDSGWIAENVGLLYLDPAPPAEGG